RFGVIGMIRVPAAADIDLLFLLLANLGDLGITAVRGKELVDVDLAPAPGERDVLFRRQLLITKEDHAIIAIGGADRLHVAVARIPEIDAQHFRAAAWRHFPDSCRSMRHVFLPWQLWP